MPTSTSAKTAAPAPGRRPPLVVDLDGTLTRTDTLHETFAAALFKNPFLTLLVVLRGLLGGRAGLKQALARLAPLDVEALPLCEPLLAYLQQERGAGRELHLATAADRSVAEAVAARVGLFERVFASDGRRNLKGAAKGQALAEAFPQGFAYAGDCAADLAVWRLAAGAVVVGGEGLARRAAAATEVEQHIAPEPAGLRAWLKAARPHQWTKNIMVLVPSLLGWWQVTPQGLVRTLAALAFMCALSSLTYILNDIADVASDRRHARKQRRPFASGALKLGHGVAVSVLGLPLVLGLAWAFAGPGAFACLASYGALTLAYSAGLKRTPLLDCLIIGGLFTLRIAAGVTAGGLLWSPWLLTFSLTFFFSLAMAKRLTELVAGGPAASGVIRGRGFRYEDHNMVMAFGVATSTLSVLIIVLYLMEEVFPRGAYHHPVALWAAPPLLFMWLGRIWLLAGRGEMHHDPVVFALQDKVSYLIGAVTGAALLIAVL